MPSVLHAVRFVIYNYLLTNCFVAGYNFTMRYKMIISDFDGTLLRRDDTVSPRTKKAIADFTAAGGVFGISTGRAYTSICQRLDELGLHGSFPILCCQGALSRDSVTGEILGSIPMATPSAVEFLRRAQTSGHMAQFYTAGNIYAPEYNEINGLYFKMNRLRPQEVGDIVPFAQQCKEPILKTLCFVAPEERQQMLALFADIADIKVCASHPMLIEAMSVSAGKGNGLVAECKRRGIPPEQCVAIGDEQNDVEMLVAAGLGVAMGNAVAEAKAAADHVTSDCNHDGVAEVIEKILSNAEFSRRNAE